MSSPTRLLLIRHGEVEGRYQDVFSGRIDMELSPTGRTQATVLAAWLRRHPIKAIYASPMGRVQETLEPLKPLCAQPTVVMEDLKEVDFGAWTGLTGAQVEARFGAAHIEWLDKLEAGAIPGAESGPSFRSRIEPCLRQILGGHGGQQVAIVCHGGVIRMMLAILLGMPLGEMVKFHIEYASVTQVALHPHQTRAALLGFTPWRDLR